MENASGRLQYKVGLFVAISLIAAMASILALGGNRAVFTRYLHLRAQFGQVQGLFAGSVVSLAGLPIGNVKKIYFVPGENKLEILMQIDQEFRHRLRAGTTAEIRTQGALGDKFVYLAPGAPAQPELKNGDLVEAIDDGDFMKMLTSKEDGVGRALELVKEMHLLVASLNHNSRIANTAQNMADASDQFKKLLPKIDLLVGSLREQIPDNKKFKQAIASLANVLEKVDQGKGTLGALVNDPSVHQNLKAFLGGSPRNRYLKEMVRETIHQNEIAK